MASCVDAGPGRRLVVAMASSNSLASIHSRSSTHSRRSKAMWVGGPPNPMQPRRSHCFPIVASGTGVAAPFSTSSLVGVHQLSSPSNSRASSLSWRLVDARGPSALRGRQVGTANSTVDDMLLRSDEPFGLHLVQSGIQRSGAYPIPMARQLLRHPGAVYLGVRGVMKHVQPHCPSEELAHEAWYLKSPLLSTFDIDFRYRSLGFTGSGLGSRDMPSPQVSMGEPNRITLPSGSVCEPSRSL